MADAYAAGRRSATLPRYISELAARDNDARLRSHSSGPGMVIADGLSETVKSRSAAKTIASRSPLGLEVHELMSDDLTGDPRSLSKFSSFKASSRVIGSKLKNLFVSKGKLGSLKGDDADSHRDSLDYNMTNSSGNSSSIRNSSFSRSTLARWNGSQSGSTRPHSPLRQLFDALDPNSQAPATLHPRPSLSSLGANSSLAVPTSTLNEPSSTQHQQRSLGRKGGVKSLRALASFGRLKDVSRPKLEASPPKLAVKRTFEDVAPLAPAVAFPTEPNYVRQHQISQLPSPSSSRQRRGRTGSDARSSRRRVPSNASSQGRRRVPSRAPAARLPTIVDVKTFRMSERDSWIHIDDDAPPETNGQGRSIVVPPQDQAQQEGPAVLRRMPTFSFTSPIPTPMDKGNVQNLPQLPSSSQSPARTFRFSATPSSVLIHPSTGPGPTLPSFKISTASEIFCAAQTIGSQQQEENAGRMMSRSSSNLQQGLTLRQNESLHHQSSRDSLPCPPRAKRLRAMTASSRNSSSTGISTPAGERSPNVTGTDHTMTSVRTVGSSILYYGADLTPSRARPPSMMCDTAAQEEATEVLRQKFGMMAVWPPQSGGVGDSDQSDAAEQKQSSRLANPAPHQPLPPLPGAQTSGAHGSKTHNPEQFRRTAHKEDCKDQDQEDMEEIGDNTLTDTPGPEALSRGVCGVSRMQSRLFSSRDSVASILSYESTDAGSTDEDIQSLIDGISADCHETTDAAVVQCARDVANNEGMAQRTRLNASSTSEASSAYSDFQLSTALTISNLPRAKASSHASGSKADAQRGQERDRSGHSANRVPTSSQQANEADRTFGRADSRIPIAQRRGENEAGSLREALTLRFPLPKPYPQNPNAAEGSSRPVMNNAMGSANYSHPPTSFQRHIHGSSTVQARGRNDQDMTQSGLADDGNNGQMLKRISNSGQSHHSHLSLVLAHLEESPCPPPRRRRAPLILGPSTQVNF
ncbi:unnamed protein product [Tilletia controversa]|nr:hypothetical protein CF336_g2839 [Tilletia laevis]KAE8262739.1 hypothetical protein A4X03_0g2217 [Tilletia caries]CAD6960940.1 unnamed protein product [Tilletia controversa]CAD6890441.1 unnamed protein product [Tilletia caries]CAD6961977.1 unnamed protein product [Tilletia laevis]